MQTDEPPVEAIQGEARAREVLVQSGMHEDADRATGLVPYAIAIRAMLAFQSEARAVPAGGELRDMPADDEIRLLREALTIYGDRVRMARSARPDLQQVIDYAFEHTPNRPAFGGDSETRHLPHQADREAIAVKLRRQADFNSQDCDCCECIQCYATSIMVEAANALSPTPSAGCDGGGEQA